TAADLLTWLRTPGKAAAPEAVDRIEQRLRRAGIATARDAVDMLARDEPRCDGSGAAELRSGGSVTRNADGADQADRNQGGELAAALDALAAAAQEGAGP